MLCILSLWGCQKEDTMLYEQNPGVYFTSDKFNYSFLENPGQDTKTIKLAVDITGSQVDYKRMFLVTTPVKDTITTAEEDQYIIGKGVVEANEYNGYVEVELFSDQRLDDSIYVLQLEIQPTKDFPEVRLNKKNLVLSFTNKAIKPMNWSALALYFGNAFSSRWWNFICEATGRTSFPYNPADPDKETWYMTPGEIGSCYIMVRDALNKYNQDHPYEPLRHDDGDYAGEEVRLPDVNV